MTLNSENDILEIDAFVRKYFNDRKEKIKYYEQKLKSLKVLKKMSFPEKIKKDIIQSEKKMLETISDTEKDISFDYYLLYSFPILEKYRKLLETPITISFMDRKPINYKEKNTLIRQYFELLKKININFANIKVKDNKILDQDLNYMSSSYSVRSERKERKKICKEIGTCKECGMNDYENVDERTYVCLNCGVQQEIIPTSITYKDNSHVVSNIKDIYQRRLHFRDTINQFQGKQSCYIDPVIYEELESELERRGLLVGNKTTPKKIRYKKIKISHIILFLKEINHGKKHYENAVLIYHNLTGKQTPDISHLENKLFEDFDQLNTMYDKIYIKAKKIDRTSFINIQYVLFQLLRKNGYKCCKEDFNMLKSHSTKQSHDEICKELFEKLNWNFTPVW